MRDPAGARKKLRIAFLGDAPIAKAKKRRVRARARRCGLVAFAPLAIVFLGYDCRAARSLTCFARCGAPHAARTRRDLARRGVRELGVELPFRRRPGGICKTQAEIDPQCDLSMPCPSGKNCVSNVCYFRPPDLQQPLPLDRGEWASTWNTKRARVATAARADGPGPGCSRGARGLRSCTTPCSAGRRRAPRTRR